jgi:Protein of unknown function (DUF2948)
VDPRFRSLDLQKGGVVTGSLKLIALDREDLGVLSVHMQDAVLQVGDMAFLPHERRFAVIANRFDWTTAVAGAPSDTTDRPYMRHRTALRFERVLAARVSGIDLKDKRQTLNVLALQFTEGAAPAGQVTIICAGGAAIRLDVECLEAELKDLGAVWSAKMMPHHNDAALAKQKTTE